MSNGVINAFCDEIIQLRKDKEQASSVYVLFRETQKQLWEMSKKLESFQSLFVSGVK